MLRQYISIILLILAVAQPLSAQERADGRIHGNSDSKPSYERPSKNPTHGSFEINDYYEIRAYTGRLLENGFLEETRGKFINVDWPPVVSNRIEKALLDNVELYVELRGKLHYHQPDYRSPIGSKYTLHEPEILISEESPMELFVPRTDLDIPADAKIVTIKGTALRDIGVHGPAAFLVLDNSAIRLSKPWSDSMRELIHRVQAAYRKNTVVEIEGYYLPGTHGPTGLRQFVLTGIKKATMKKFVDSPLIRRNTTEGLPVVTEYLQAEGMIGAPVVLEGSIKLNPALPANMILRHYREDRPIPVNFPNGTINNGIVGNYKARISGTIGPGPCLENPKIELLEPTSRQF